MGEGKANFIIAVILLGLAAFGALFISSSRKMRAPDVKLLEFPMQIGEWSGKDMPVDKRIYEILGTDKVLTRVYADGKGEQVILAVVYGEQRRQSFHPPEYCYLGGGNIELLEKDIGTVKFDEEKSMKVNRLIFQMNTHRELVLYWFTAGERMTENYYKQQVYFVMDQFTRRKSGGTLVRVSTPIGADAAAAFERSQRFIREILKVLPSYL